MQATRYVSFGGGGTAGFAFHGAMRAMRTCWGASPFSTWRQNLLGVSGCSAGALYCLWFVLGCDEQHKRHLFSRVDLSRIVSLVNIDQCNRQLGFSDMDEVRRIIHVILECGGLSANATMADLHRFTRVHTVFVASNLSTQACEYIDHTVHADMRIDDALCSSCAIPLLYHPVRYADTLLVDGCMTNATADFFPRDATLYLSLQMPRATAVTDITLVEYVSLLFAMCATQTRNALHDGGIHVKSIHLRHCAIFDPTASLRDVERDGYISGLACFSGMDVVAFAGALCRQYVVNVLDPKIMCDEEVPPVTNGARVANSANAGA